MDIAFYTERSVTDEVARGGEGDVLTIFISYIVMFVYISLSLGRLSSASRFFVGF